MARMTTTMAMDFVRSDMDILQSAETMMDAPPVCEVRKISYATFTIFDMQASTAAPASSKWATRHTFTCADRTTSRPTAAANSSRRWSGSGP